MDWEKIDAGWLILGFYAIAIPIGLILLYLDGFF